MADHKTDIPTHLNIRIDAQLRYFTELAAKARGMTVTEYVSDALTKSFKNVSIDPPGSDDEEPNYHELSFQERMNQLKNVRTITNPLSEVTDRLWDDNPLVRVQLLAGHLEHLMSDENRIVWNYLFTRPDFKTANGKFNRKLIGENWPHIKAEALRQAQEGKVK